MYQVQRLNLPTFGIAATILVWNIITGSFIPLIALISTVIFFGSFQSKFSIHDDHVQYQVYILFKVPIFNRVIYPNQINEIKFFRVGWLKKAAILRLKKGLNIRLANMVRQ
ncbi:MULTISPECIES: hypothetical protein [Bacillaceae]|uniref:Uncharacterized protein n=1 Tax=Evansella alkalicola TaxID=745819 RepID=A0ABS6JS02_9BACI|nr:MULTISPECIES: hypothetical protein [Bacillaceae]MBU9721263.1 hypothetical protein [Bacillus alkalicola]